ncbi:MAG TPA: sigma-70 family RNA polymerase sigma factor [Gemmatirosa sp.]
MADRDWLAAHFEAHRERLRGVAYRLLGSLSDADDALQEAWLRVSRSDAAVANAGGWLTTVVSRVCLDLLRARAARREHALEALDGAAPAAAHDPRADPEHEAVLADAVGVALLVVLDTLSPVDRTVFVLHEMFAVPFDDVARIVGKTPAAARQIASRARRRVRGPARGGPTRGGPTRGAGRDVGAQRAVVEAFVAALRAGDLEALLGVLDPAFIIRADAAVSGTPTEVRGAAVWAPQALAGFARAVRAARGPDRVQPALVDGVPGLILAPHGRLRRALRFTFAHDRVVAIDVIGDPERLRALTLAVPLLPPIPSNPACDCRS